MPRWMINCKEYATLASNCMDRKLSLWERFSMKLHQWLCPPCHEVRNQLELIRKACRSMLVEDQDLEDNTKELSQEARLRIKSTLKDISK